MTGKKKVKKKGSKRKERNKEIRRIKKEKMVSSLLSSER